MGVFCPWFFMIKPERELLTKQQLKKRKHRIREFATSVRLKNNKTVFNSLCEMLEYLPDEIACREYLEYHRWKKTPICPHCNNKSKKHYELRDKGIFKGGRKCRICKKEFTVKTKTMFEKTYIPLRKWFMFIYMFNTHRKGLSSHQVARDLGITQRTAWFMLGRLRYSSNLEKDLFPAQIDKAYMVLVKCDETFVGGKNHNRHWDKKVKNSQGRSYIDKTAVFGLVYRGKVYARVIPNTQRPTIEPIIRKLVPKGAIIVSDEWSAYEELSSDYTHIILNHETKQYGYAGFNGNEIEGFWSLLKRGIIGVYHKVSRKHLQLYVDEFCFRYNTRNLTNEERFRIPLIFDKGKITYNELIGKKYVPKKKVVKKKVAKKAVKKKR
jgi:transposase-like protein